MKGWMEGLKDLRQDIGWVIFSSNSHLHNCHIHLPTTYYQEQQVSMHTSQVTNTFRVLMRTFSWRKTLKAITLRNWKMVGMVPPYCSYSGNGTFVTASHIKIYFEVTADECQYWLGSIQMHLWETEFVMAVPEVGDKLRLRKWQAIDTNPLSLF